MNPGLTRTQWELLGFIHGFIRDHGHSPTYDEMRLGTGRAGKGNVHRLVEVLAERGFINRSKNRACSITLTSRGLDRIEAYRARNVVAA